mgnify:CR=1 FL=1
MYGGSIKNQTIAIDTTVENGGETKKQSVEANAFDVTVKVPITTSKKIAEKLKLSDFKVFLNGSDTAMVTSEAKMIQRFLIRVLVS